MPNYLQIGPTVDDLRQQGCAVVVFTAEELASAEPRDLEDFLVQHGNEWLAANCTEEAE